MYVTTLYVTCHLRHVEYEQARQTCGDHHGDGKAVGGVAKQVLGEDEADGGANAHQDHHNVHRYGHESRVVDVEVLDIATLVGQEEPKHHQQSLVHVEGSNEVGEVRAGAALDVLDQVVVGVLIKCPEEVREFGECVEGSAYMCAYMYMKRGLCACIERACHMLEFESPRVMTISKLRGGGGGGGHESWI